MKEVTLTVECNCGFRVQRTFRTNEHGYFEIPDAHCPNCFNVLVWFATEGPIDAEEECSQKKN